MNGKITSRLVKSLKPAEKVYSVRDTETKGFLLRVSPTGGMTYFFDYRTKSGQRKTYRIGSGITAVQARDVAEQLAAAVAHGRDPQEEKKAARKDAEQAKVRTLSGFLEQRYSPWVMVERKRGDETLKRIKANFADLLERPMAELNTWLLEKWRAEQRKAGKKPTTINRDVIALKAALSKAVEWGVLPTHPLAGLKPIKTDRRGKVRYLSGDEEKRLRIALIERDARLKAERARGNLWRRQRGYEELPDLSGHTYVDHLTPMVLLSLNTGLRRGEVFTLAWESVSLGGRTLTVEGSQAKSGTTRHVPLNAEALQVLKTWKAQHKQPRGLVFPGKEGAPMDNVRKAWAGVLEKAKVTCFRWHDLRHTFASKLVMAGVDLNTVRELLGHTSLEVTLRYAHLAPEHKAEAVGRLVSS